MFPKNQDSNGQEKKTPQNTVFNDIIHTKLIKIFSNILFSSFGAMVDSAALISLTWQPMKVCIKDIIHLFL